MGEENAKRIILKRGEDKEGGNKRKCVKKRIVKEEGSKNLRRNSK